MSDTPLSTRILVGDCRAGLATLPAESVHTCVTSPPYWGLRDYKIAPTSWPDGWHGCLGLEPELDLYVEHMAQVFRAVWRVLRHDGTLWLNLGDSYSNQGKSGGKSGGKNYTSVNGNYQRTARQTGLKPKDRCMIPARVALALQADGWYLRDEIVWHKPNAMPSSVEDRTTPAHEMLYLLTKSRRYYYDSLAVRTPSRYVGMGLPANWDTTPGSHRAASGHSGHKDVRRTRDELAAQKANQRARTGKTAFRGQSHLRYGNGACNRDGRDMRDVDANLDGTANLRSVWEVATSGFAGAHFATFPTALVERPVKAGTSERGVCSDCGAPYARGAEYESAPTRTGWMPTCKCAAVPVPAVVLDPFAGACTTGLVAARLGCSFVGCEASAEYAQMGAARLRADMPLFCDPVVIAVGGGVG